MSQLKTNTGSGIDRIVAEASRSVEAKTHTTISELQSANPPAAPPTEHPEPPTSQPDADVDNLPGSHKSTELGEMVDDGVKVEIDHREKERLARQGRVAGAD